MPDKKEKRINIPVTEEQYEKWKAVAEQNGMTLSSFVRYCAASYVKAVQRYVDNNK